MDSYRNSGRPERKSVQELRERLFPRAQEDGIGMRRCLEWQRRHVQAAEGDEAAQCAVAIRQAVGPIRVGDVDLDHDQVRLVVVEDERLDVLVFE